MSGFEVLPLMADVCIEFADTGRVYRSRSQLIDAVPFCDRMADRHIRC